jgi:hypothetical protein
MSLCDDHTFCLDQTTSKDPYHYDLENTLQHIQQPMISDEGLLMTHDYQVSGRKSALKHQTTHEYNTHPAKNNLTLNTDYERPTLSSEQDYRFRSNFQKLLKLRDKVRQKKISLMDRGS